MSAAGERMRAKAEEDTFASGAAKPRLEERVREQRWRPPNERVGIVEDGMVAARRRAIEAADSVCCTKAKPVRRPQVSAKVPR